MLVRGQVMRLLAAGAAAAALIAGDATAHGAAPAPCRAVALAGTFAYVPGSAGAGNVVYRLTLTNRDRADCGVEGRPQVRLLDRRGVPLPTHVVSDRRGGTAGPVLLRPGGRAVATARFSPDVPGSGEPVDRPCEKVAHKLRVHAAGRSLVVAVRPPTRVCQRGQLQFSFYERGA